MSEGWKQTLAHDPVVYVLTVVLDLGGGQHCESLMGVFASVKAAKSHAPLVHEWKTDRQGVIKGVDERRELWRIEANRVIPEVQEQAASGENS